MRPHLCFVILVLFPITTLATSWSCGTTIEVGCNDGSCYAREEEEGAPIYVGVSFNSAGYVRVCAYTGCWKGQGRVLSHEPFFVIAASKLRWSDPGNDITSDILVAFYEADAVALLKADFIAGPYICKEVAEPAYQGDT